MMPRRVALRRHQISAVAWYYDLGTETEYLVHRDTPAWTAGIDWLHFHSIDHHDIPLETWIIRDPQYCRIHYSILDYTDDHLIRLDANGWPIVLERVEQGEAPPLPFPPEFDSVAAEVGP